MANHPLTALPTAVAPDVAIVGGGVAGSALAIVLRRQGLDVHLVEREPFFRDRIRGETVHPWGTAEMAQLGLLDLAIDRAGALPQPLWQTYRDREPQEPHRWADTFPGSPHGLGFGHVALQDALIEEARESGVIVHRPARVTFERIAGRVSLKVDSPAGTSVLRPRLVVGADGSHSATRRWIGGHSVADPPHHHLGGALVRGFGLESDRIHQAYFDGGFVFVSPQDNDVARLYLVCATTEAMEIQRDPDPAARIVARFREAMPEGRIGPDWESIGPVGFFSNAVETAAIPSTPDVVLIGDASGKNDPSQGHGLSLVFRDVRALSVMLANGERWDDVPDRFHAARQRDFETLRQHAHWNERQATETGPEIDAIRDRISRAREVDPSAGGFAGIFATGPAGLVASEDARRHYLGEDLQPSVAAGSGADQPHGSCRAH